MAETKLAPFQIDVVALGQDPDLLVNIDHTGILNIGINSHTDIDSHIDGTALNHAAGAITYDNSLGYYNGIELQDVIDESGSAISVRETAASGTRKGGEMTPNGITPATQIDIAAGSGVFVNSWTDPDHTGTALYAWSAIVGFTVDLPDNIGVQSIYVTSGGSPVTITQQAGLLTDSEIRSNTLLGLIYYSNGSIDAIENTPRVINNVSYTFYDYINFLTFNDTTTGLLTESVDNALSVWVTGGTLFQVGIAWFVDPKTPNVLDFDSDGDINTPVLFDVVLSDGSIYLSDQTVMPKFYEAGSPPAAVALAGTEAVIHYFFQLRGGRYIIQLGDSVYPTGTDAQAGLAIDFSGFATFPNSDISFLSAQIYIGNTATNFVDPDLAGILNFVNAGASGSGGGSTPGGVNEFLELTDVIPTTYATEAGKMVTVNGTESGLIFSLPPATNITYDDTNTGLTPPGSPTNTVDNVQYAIEQLNLKRRFKNTTHTGIRVGGFISSNTTTTFDITDGDGAILDQALTPTNATGIVVTWVGLIGITLTQVGSGNGATYIFINSVGTVLQFTTVPSKSTYIQNIFLGIVFYEAGVITLVSNSPYVLDSTAINFSDYVIFHKNDNHKGIKPLAIGSGQRFSSLEFYVTSGELFAEGINLANDVYNPNTKAIAADGIDDPGPYPSGTGATFTYILGDGTIFATGQTILDELIYDDGTSTPGVVPDGDGLIQFIIKVPGGGLYVQMYTKTYRDGQAAQSGVESALDDLVLADQIKEGTIIGAYTGQSDTDNWERGDRNAIISIGGTPSSGGGISNTSASYFIDLTVLTNVVTETSIPTGWTTASTGTGIITITHNLNDLQPGFALSVLDAATFGNVVQATAITNNTIAIQITDAAGTVRDGQIVGKLLL